MLNRINVNVLNVRHDSASLRSEFAELISQEIFNRFLSFWFRELIWGPRRKWKTIAICFIHLYPKCMAPANFSFMPEKFKHRSIDISHSRNGENRNATQSYSRKKTWKQFIVNHNLCNKKAYIILIFFHYLRIEMNGSESRSHKFRIGKVRVRIVCTHFMWSGSWTIFM